MKTQNAIENAVNDGKASNVLAEKIKTIQQEYEVLKIKVREFGISDFIFNAKISMYKKILLHQKTNDEQVIFLVTRKHAFSTGGLWMAIGFQLM